jgi:hypothetical protein
MLCWRFKVRSAASGAVTRCWCFFGRSFSKVMREPTADTTVWQGSTCTKSTGHHHHHHRSMGLHTCTREQQCAIQPLVRKPNCATVQLRDYTCAIASCVTVCGAHGFARSGHSRTVLPPHLEQHPRCGAGLVHDHRLDVRVDQHCATPCGNGRDDAACQLSRSAGGVGCAV